MESLAHSGDAAALRELEGPECPEEFEYLVEWAEKLHGRSGANFGAILPLSYTTIADWARLCDITLEPYEVEALLALDTAMMVATSPAEEKAPSTESREKKGAWPTRRTEQ